METDYTKWKNFFENYGLNPKTTCEGQDETGKVLCFEKNTDTKVIGYQNFVVVFYFDEKEKFTKIGIWE